MTFFPWIKLTLILIICSVLAASRIQQALIEYENLNWSLKESFLKLEPLSRRQSCSYEGSNRRQRVSIQSCILENKRHKHSAKTLFARVTRDSSSGKIPTAECIRNDYRTINNKQRFTRESVKSVKSSVSTLKSLRQPQWSPIF